MLHATLFLIVVGYIIVGAIVVGCRVDTPSNNDHELYLFSAVLTLLFCPLVAAYCFGKVLK